MRFNIEILTIQQSMPIRSISPSTPRVPYSNKAIGHAIAWLFAMTLLGACSKPIELDPSVKALVFKTLSGDDIILSDENGPTLVNFWSTSCAICIREMPEMVQLYDRYVSEGFQLIAVAMPYDAPNDVLELSQAKNLPFPVALDLKGEAVAAFGSVKGTPTSFLLDSNGNLIDRYIGAIDIEDLRSTLNKLLETS